MWSITFIVLVGFTGGSSSDSYNNFLQGIIYYKCPFGQVLSEFTSSPYSAAEKDRQWILGCQSYPTLDSCFWSSPVAPKGQDFEFACPASHVVRGVYSQYLREYNSRSWVFECCKSKDIVHIDCQNDTRVNYWNEGFKWSVPGGNYLTGLSAGHRSSSGDVRWSYTYCRAVRDDLTVTSQILAVNSLQQISLTQGDVPLRLTRNANVNSDYKWPMYLDVVQVPFTISSDFTGAEINVIKTAMQAFSLSTCVKFVPRTFQYNYVSIVKQSGCWSYVGRQGGEQKLSLGYGCVFYGIVQHELIHALNFWHEQNRSDRDDWVQIHPENIIEGKEHNFKKRETDNLGAEYDYFSVMHYGATDFSANGKDTITPLVPSASIGQRFGMTETDILKINKLYACKAFLPKYGEWDNQLGDVLSVTCVSGQAVSHVKSGESGADGRLWRVSCRAFQSDQTPLCQWSAYLNDYQAALDYKCPDNRVISGVYAERSSVQKDRRWKVQCCSVQNFVTYNCKTTSPVNYWTEAFAMPIASGNYLTGIQSSYSAEFHDRRWSFTYCQGRFQ
ncbi:zinc metalloproteinase nas-30-like [Periophthalmus magnuspinnatus]|uniref:zinc metalloproteinase nas-30-like n=1 Tax=Periophthalmus magnuspinnatus TaxID=409849 RepID=UPI0024367640|nr:zinc metalloproteinase nas-30-like [Periophthalmus magnuspinnatus]